MRLRERHWHQERNARWTSCEILRDDPPRHIPHRLGLFRTTWQRQRLRLDLDLLMKSLKCARRCAAPGPSGMMSEHLRSVLENPRDAGLLFQVAQLFATAHIPQEVLAALRVGRLTALQKPNGSVQGIMAGDVFRLLVARTMSQPLGPAIERATSPFQCARRI